MSRFEGDFAASGTPLDDGELRNLIAQSPAMADWDRRQATACYLSGADGWDRALQALRGAFAADAAGTVRLSGAQQDKREINQYASEYLQWQALKTAATDND